MTQKVEKTLIREDIEWISIRWHNASNVDMPRVLLVGDSIVQAHGTKVHELLKEIVCVDYFATAKHVADSEFMEELLFMMSRRKYDLILFNNGLHGFGIDDELYKPALREALLTLKENSKKLCWRVSTPILDNDNFCKFNAERNPRVIRRNADAAEIAKELDLPMLDLYTLMAKNKQLFAQDAIHYNDEGTTEQAKIVAEFIKKQLS